MAYAPAKGKTLLIPSGTEQDPHKRHLFVILTNRCALDSHLLVSLSRVKEGVHFDDACLFEVGEHPFVREQSFAAYRLARIVRAATLIGSVDGDYFTSKEDMSAALVERMCAGIERSEFIAPKFVAYYRRNAAL